MMSFAPKRAPIRRRTKLAVAFVSVLPLLTAGAAEASVIVSSGFEGGSQLINCALGQCFRPPDTMGAVGTTQFLETSNGSIRIYDKNTGAVQSSVNMAAFWAAAGQPGGAGGDQRVLFDHYTNRWIVSGFGPTGNTVNIAVSSNANALGPWQSTRITGVVGTTLDYPTLSLDNKGVYIGTNNFNSSDTFTGTSVFVIPKTGLFGGAPTLTDMTTLTTPAAGPNNGFAIQAALNWQGNPTNTAAVMADSKVSDAQVFYRLSGVNGAAATQSASATITGSHYAYYGDGGRQPDGSQVVDLLSPRISANVAQLNGKLYSAITVENPNDLGHSGVRWSVVDALSGSLIGQGFIGGGGYDYYEGSIAVNEFGEAVIGYNRSGFQTDDSNGDGLADGNISFLARAFLVDGIGGLDQQGSDMLLRVSGISDYHCGTRTNPADCRERWGDYSAVTFDPTNHHDFFAIGEYASEWAVIPNFTTTERAIWNTYIAKIAFTQSTAVPEPETYLLVLLGLALATVSTRRGQPTTGVST
ncbi:PEP-CTERM sorting domain-containing protein [Candidatus Accumulibacter sp. ACC003]|uniref:PEP-CTERM sorting domain-containing protein n=1 Tax=Candidatus Accumulibacter sp. ACC003 TaxID=2823334 RepID=UPI0025B9790E|nr:PEP-CTERM sorting domain-containing protein [Candidatus Accumulibacter sp. ACC003]